MTGSPWIYAVVAASVLLDVFVPLLPSGVLVVAVATAAAGTTAADAANLPSHARDAAGYAPLPEMLLLVLCAACASVVGDLAAYRLAWRGGERFDRAIARSRRLATAQERLGHALVQRGGGALVVLARFAPAGRSVVSLTAGASHRSARDFIPWSALAGLAWAAYSVSLGYFGSQWLGASWLGTAVSVCALFAAGALAAHLIRREPHGRPRKPAHATATTAATPADSEPTALVWAPEKPEPTSVPAAATTSANEPTPSAAPIAPPLPVPVPIPVVAAVPAMRTGGEAATTTFVTPSPSPSPSEAPST
ncbi:DedA family protein [Streptomyces sp. NPDC048172]|uniref:DedA family protein n=1 Tax=Streptomyces sp. NPDC048172 TaxID=3365505 RepID=UPI00371450B2